MADASNYKDPAYSSELDQRGVSLKPDVIAPTGGVYTNIADVLRPDMYARVLNNVQMTKRNIWTSRGIGWTKHRSSSFNSGASFLNMHVQATDTSGTDRFVFQVGSVVYAYDLATQTETSLKTGLTASKYPCFTSYAPDQMIYTNNNLQPQKWNSPASGAGTWSALGGWPVTLGGKTYTKPKFCEVFCKRLVTAGFDAKPHSLVFSLQGDPADYTASGGATDAGAIELPETLGDITGIRTIRIANDTNDAILLVGCSRGMAFISGTDATNFETRELTRSFGLVSNRTWVQIGDNIYFMATDGIRRYSNFESSAFLLTEHLSAPVHDLWARLNTSAQATAFAVHHPATFEVQWWFPIDSDTNPKNAFIMNYNTQALDQPTSSVTVRPIWSTKDGITTANCGIEYNGVMYTGSTDGYLQVHYSGDDFNGTRNNWSIMPALVEANTNNPGQSGSVRAIHILTEGPAQAFTATSYVVDTLSTDESMWEQVHTQTLSASASSVTNLNTWGSGTTTTYPKIIPYNPVGSGRYWAHRFYAAADNDHINFVGIMSLMTMGGLKQ